MPKPMAATTTPTTPTTPRTPTGAAPTGVTRVGPPTKHQLALMIWVAVFPTLTVLNLTLGGWLGTMSPVLRTFVLATIAVPVVIYGLMPSLHRLRTQVLTRAAHRQSRQGD